MPPTTVEDIRARVATLPRVPLALTPTPLHELPRLAKAIGVGRLFVKRDDLTGLAFGGNKTRNLEFRMGEAVAQQADVMIAGLEAQSNSARQTAAAANILGMKTILVLRGGRDWCWQGNLLVDAILGAEVRFLEIDDPRPATATTAMDQALHHAADEQRQLGHRPYVMNHGQSFALGSALGYLLCTCEIVEQMQAIGAEPTDLYMTSGNKGHAGLLLGRSLLGKSFRPVAISQHYSDDRKAGAIKGAREAAQALGWDVRLSDDEVESYDDYVGEAYGLPTPAAMSAIKLAAKTEGLLLDPVYTAKGMAGLIDHARTGRVGPESVVVFIHTGGLPALFAWKDEVLGAVRPAAAGAGG